jgi:hypothetical protein
VPILSATKEESRKVKLSGTRTEVLLFKGTSVFFYPALTGCMKLLFKKQAVENSQ